MIQFPKIAYRHTDKQLIIVTHNSALLPDDFCDKLIHFSLQDSITITHIFKEQQYVTTVNKNMQLLFTKKCIFVEGYTDYKFVTAFLKKIDILYEYVVIYMGGADEFEKYLNIARRLNISHKFILDLDVLFVKNKKAADKYRNINGLYTIKKTFVEKLQTYFEINVSEKYDLDNIDETNKDGILHMIMDQRLIYIWLCGDLEDVGKKFKLIKGKNDWSNILITEIVEKSTTETISQLESLRNFLIPIK